MCEYYFTNICMFNYFLLFLQNILYIIFIYNKHLWQKKEFIPSVTDKPRVRQI